MSRIAELADSPFDLASSLEMNEALRDFVRQELRRYRLATLEDGKTVSVAVLAGRIQAVDDKLDFAPETLRRFLGDASQRTAPAVIRAAASFLIEEEWFTRADLEARGRNTDYRAAFALGEFFGIRSSKNTDEFCRGLAGAYREYRLDTDRFIKTDVTISVLEASSVLRFTETVQQYELDNEEVVFNKFASNGINLFDYAGLDRLEFVKAVKIGRPLVTSGFGVSDHRILAFFVTDTRTGQPQIYNVYAIRFDDDDAVLALETSVSAGWQAAAQTADEQQASSPDSPRAHERRHSLHKKQQAAS